MLTIYFIGIVFFWISGIVLWQKIYPKKRKEQA